MKIRKILFIIPLMLSLFLIACESDSGSTTLGTGTTTDLCDGVTCTGHGTCAVASRLDHGY